MPQAKTLNIMANRKPALHLVDTRKLDRTEWLEIRKTGIGASDAAAVVGLSPYKSPLDGQQRRQFF